MAARHLFIFGIGFSGAEVARRLLPRFDSVGGTVRSAEKATRLRAEGIEALVFDGEADAPLRTAIGRTTHLLQSIPPGEDGDPVLAALGDIDAMPDLAWIGYLSTVGVYGDHAGGWVDETTECRPVSRRSVERLDAERAWAALAAAKGVPLAVLRLAGIYGPGRNQIENLRAGTARRIVKEGQVFNRIHVEDISRSIAACLTTSVPGGVFNVTDDEPAPPQDVVTYGANLLGIEPPPEVPFVQAAFSPMALSFWGQNKRVANRRLRDELKVELAFPTYREGLRSLLSSLRGA